jgi:DNA invertase Pin-like site-specific DNA recombinase
VNAIGYIRLSRADESSTSPQRQREAIERYCSEHDLTLVEILEDIDVSGSSTERKGLEAALFRLGEGDRLVAWKLDRIYRSVVGFAALVKRLSDVGAVLVTTDGRADMSTPQGRAMVWVSMIFAELEIAMMSERSKNMHAHLRKSGVWATSRVPMGWRKENGHLVEDPEGQATLVKMASQFAAGASFRDVGRAFGMEHTSVRWMLRSDRVLAAFPPGLAERVRAELAGRPSGYRGSKSLLGGFARCGVCGGPLKLSKRPRWVAYGCRDKGHVYINAEWLDQYVSDQVIKAIDVKKLAKRFPVKRGGEAQGIEERIETLEIDHYERGLIGRDSYLRRREALLRRLEAARKTPAATSIPREIALHLPERWPSLSVPTRRRIIAAVLERVEVQKVTKRIGRAIDPSRVSLDWRS